MVTAREKLVLLLLPAIGALVVACALVPYGPALDRAGLHSMAAASSLLDGEGVRMSRGEAFTLWPPLLPFLLASAKSLGVPYVRAATALNVGSCFVLAVSVGFLAARVGRSLWAGLLAQTALLASPVVLKSLLTVKTEPLFLALVVLTACGAMRLRDTGEMRWWALAALSAALACLQRYVGIVFALTTAAWLLFAMKDRVARRAWLHATAFALVALLPVALWMLRNVVAGDDPSGLRDEADRSLAANAGDALRTVAGFLAPEVWPTAARGVLVGGCALVVLVGGLVLQRREPDRLAALLYVAALPVTYALFLIAYASRTQLDALVNRLMLPVLPFALVLLAVGAMEVQRWARRSSRLAGRTSTLLAVVLFGVLGLSRAEAAGTLLRKSRTQGIGGLTAKVWADSELAAWLAEQRLDEPVYSNLPELVFYFAKSPAGFLPPRRQKGFLRESELTVRPGTIVWVTTPEGGPVLRAGDVVDLEPLVRFWNGAVYRTRPRGLVLERER